jgi:spermidine/putrescine transport system substrate-binding protein
MPAPIGRRRFLAGAAAMAAASVAACSSRARALGAPAGVITVANFPFYIDATTNPGFTSATGIDVEYHEEIVDEAVWLANGLQRVVSGQPLGRDVVVVSDWAAAQLARHGAVPATGNATWAQGMVGIAYDRRALGRDLTSAKELFQPDLHGRVVLPNDARHALGIALLADDVDPSTATMDEIAATATHLANSVQLGQLLPVDGAHPIDKLIAGDASAIVTSASDTVGIEVLHPGVQFVVPLEGGLLLTDVAAVTNSAANATGGHRYVDYAGEPAHAADRFRAVPAMWTIDGVTARLDAIAPAVVADPRRNPPLDVRARLRSFRILDDDEDARLRDLFATAVTPGR